MKPTRFTRIAIAAVLSTSGLHAQTSGDPLVEPVSPVVDGGPLADIPIPGERTIANEGGLTADLPPAGQAPITPPPAAPGDPAPGGTFPPLEQQKKAMEQAEEGYLIKDANLNDIFQFLAKQAGRQYFHNSKLATPEYQVTGHLNDGNPLQQMEELAFMYGLTLYTKGSTIYALTSVQLTQLPSAEFQYQLKYLRPTDIAGIKELIKPVLRASGVVNFEPKTNTVIIIDNAQKIEAARTLLHDIDQAKGQIVVETKILRINSSAAERTGVDWANSLGSNGTTLEVARSLDSIFGINSDLTKVPNNSNAIESVIAPNANLVLSPVQLSGVLRALAQGGLAKQVSNPTLITEDNEQATISIIDRVPIITSTRSQGNGIDNITEQVRYKIGESDQSIDQDPEKHREIGISLVVTPTLLPDGTVRMKMRPRSAQITSQVKGASGNIYPRVTESMVESLARVPDGNSLVVGGFYGESSSNDRNKVPLLGDIPVINFFFKSKEATKEQTSLVFIVTPTSYDPRSSSQNSRRGDAIRSKLSLPEESDWIDPSNPGPAHEANLRRGIRGLQPQEAPYYPKTTEAPLPESSRAQIIDGSATPRFSRARR
ncbi:MAG: hypothetical protein CFE26_07340 [Verrucomicrobiales bacterium VVV1]|nr:MAG: hypothetical protein CFE26_07340 [Verrucomicrobiales bacterium VVV1]